MEAIQLASFARGKGVAFVLVACPFRLVPKIGTVANICS